MGPKEPSHEVPPRLKALLDEHHAWPTDYTFKFIVKEQDLEVALALIPDVTPQLRPSAKGSYVAMTWTVSMASSDAVLAIYAKANAIPGLLAL